MSICRFLVLLALGSSAWLQSFAERPVAIPVTASWQDQQKADIEFLASEELGGRDVANETIQIAADYISDRMSRLGLQMDSFDGSPFQPLDITLGARAGLAENNRALFTVGAAKQRLTAQLDDGFSPLAIGSSSGQITGPIAFVGYGITAPKYNYDDYAGIDVTGAIVIVLRKEPGYEDPNSRFDGTRNTRHAFFATKVETAIARGAAAVIIVNDPASILKGLQNERSKIFQEKARKEAIKKQIDNLPAEATNIRKTFEKKLIGIDKMVQAATLDLKQAKRGVLGVSEAGNRPAKDETIPVISVARDVVQQLIAASGRNLDDIQKTIDQTTAPNSMLLANANATLRVELKPTTAKSSNVVGVLPGRGPLAEETVVIGAHYDHVGMGGYGSLAPGTIAIHNGADDNASGVATLLAAASILKQQLQLTGTHRRVVFIAFTGEERGLVGSKYYVQHPLFPLASTVAMINLDMVGRLRDNELTLYGTGSADLFDKLVDRSNVRHQFKLFKVPTGYGPSDHQSFYEAGVPVLFFFTGLHNDYHRPSDDFDKIDFGGMTRITDMVSDVAHQLAIRKERPEYAETENRVRIRRQLTAYMGATLSDRGDHVVLSGLTPGGPAERGGLRIGDRLDRLGKRRIRTAADVLDLLRSRSPGESLQISVIRGPEKIVVTVRLDARPGG